MTTSNDWRPKVGERVRIKGTRYSEHVEGKEGVVKARYGNRVYGVVVADHPHHPEEDWSCDISELFPLPSAAEPRAPWEVLREAASILNHHLESGSENCRILARKLEAAAAPKPPSLAEAVLAYRDAVRAGGHTDEAYTAMREALARAEAEAGR